MLNKWLGDTSNPSEAADRLQVVQDFLKGAGEPGLTAEELVQKTLGSALFPLNSAYRSAAIYSDLRKLEEDGKAERNGQLAESRQWIWRAK